MYFKKLLFLWISIFFLALQYELAFAQGRGGAKTKGIKHGTNATTKVATPLELQTGNLIMSIPTNRSIQASVVLNKHTEAFIEYGINAKKLNQKTPSVTSVDHHPTTILLSNLTPNTTYFYRLAYRLPSTSQFNYTEVSWFSTQKTTESTFSFGVQGDSHPERLGKMFNPECYLQNFKNVAIYKPDFYFMMGDDFNIDRFISTPKETASDIEQTYVRQRSFLGQMGTNPPYFLVNGNHEQTARYLLDGTPNSAPVLATNARHTYFPMPTPDAFYTGDASKVEHIGLLKDYYAFEWGNALFVVLDPYWHSEIAVDGMPQDRNSKNKRDQWGITLGKEQYNWLQTTLENSKATFKFVFAHHVNGTGRGGVERAKYFEWGGYAQNGQWQFDQYRKGWEMPIHQLMVKHQVTIFFQGHDHLYAKQELDGVIYQTLPNPADDSHTAFNKEAYLSGQILPNAGFLNVTVSKNMVTVDYIRAFLKDNLSLGDEVKSNYSYTIKK